VEQSIQRLIIIVVTLMLSVGVITYAVFYGTTFVPTAKPDVVLLTPTVSSGGYAKLKVSNPLDKPVYVNITITDPVGQVITVISDYKVNPKASTVIDVAKSGKESITLGIPSGQSSFRTTLSVPSGVRKLVIDLSNVNYTQILSSRYYEFSPINYYFKLYTKNSEWFVVSWGVWLDWEYDRWGNPMYLVPISWDIVYWGSQCYFDEYGEIVPCDGYAGYYGMLSWVVSRIISIEIPSGRLTIDSFVDPASYPELSSEITGIDVFMSNIPGNITLTYYYSTNGNVIDYNFPYTGSYKLSVVVYDESGNKLLERTFGVWSY